MKTNDSTKSLTDEELVAQIVKTKNRLLFGALFDRFSKLVYNKCLGFSKNEDEAKDLVQEVFLKLFIKLEKFNNTQYKFSTWLSVFTYNLCVNYVKRDVSKRFEKRSVPIEESDHLLIEVDDSSLFQLKVEKLEKALELVDPEDKMILLLKYKDDVSIRELSKLLEISESAVKMRLKRSKARIVKIYNEKF